MTHSRHTTVMYRSLVLLVVLSGVSLGQKEPNDHHMNSTCPTWTVYDSSTSSCECGIDWHGLFSANLSMDVPNTLKYQWSMDSA